MGDIIISLFNMSSIKVDDKKLLVHFGNMLNNLEGGTSYMEINRSEFIRQAVSCFFISDLVNASVYSKICSVPQIPAQDITVLAKKTKLSKKELISQYEDFIARYPSGEMDRKQVVKHFEPNHENLVIDENSIFSVLDKAYRGTIKFVDFMLAEYSVFVKCAEDKLIWIFNVCDKTGKDVLEGTEIDDVVTGLFAMAGIRIENSILAARTEELV
jgi:Ca2+-binding EF-hand superfamily protein